jgi:hypothetical protein
MYGLETLDFRSNKITNSDNLKHTGALGAAWYQPYSCWRLTHAGSYIDVEYTMTTQTDVNLILRLASGVANGTSHCPITITWNGNNVVENFDPHSHDYVSKSWHIDPTITVVGVNKIRISLSSGATTMALVQQISVGNFEMQDQDQTNWCWAACSASSGNYYKRSANTWTQGALVSNQLGKDTTGKKCSGAAYRTLTATDPCNQPWHPEMGLTLVNCYAGKLLNTGLTWDQVVAEIDQGHVVSTIQYWSAGGGHNVMITGAYVGVDWLGNPGNMLVIDDPWNGHSQTSFDEYTSGYQGLGTWGMTFYTV